MHCLYDLDIVLLGVYPKEMTVQVLEKSFCINIHSSMFVTASNSEQLEFLITGRGISKQCAVHMGKATFIQERRLAILVM